MVHRISNAIGLGHLLAACLIPIVTAVCSRESLLATAESYIAAQTSGKIDELSKVLDTNVSYQENNKKATLSSGLLSKALVIDHNKTIVDTTQCATFTELISTAGPYVIGTQLRHSADGAKVTLIDTIVATTGSWMFNAKTTLGYIKTEDWSDLDEAKRSPRETLQAAADNYLNMWSNSTAMDAVPWGSPCARTEGAMHVTPNCTVGAPRGGNLKIGNRRYVIDEVKGTCEVECSFGGMADSHEFRLVSGKLVLVHTITV